MKRLLLLSTGLLFLALSGTAQFGTAPNFNVVDLDGNEIDLYEDILDQGLIAVVDVSATWCGPCWSLHTSHALEDLHLTYGPDGTNQLRVIFYEADAGTTLEDLQGTGGNTWGDWLTGSSYPFINESPITLDLNIWAPLGFPTVNVIRPSDYEIVADTWNLLSLEEQVTAINGADTGIVLDPDAVSVDEVEAIGLNVFPNPTEGRLSVDLSAFTGSVSLEVYDLIGNVVYSTVSERANETLNLEELSQGQYILQASNDRHNVEMRIAITK